MKWFILSIIFGIFSTSLYAENVPLPASISGVDEMIFEFRNQLSTKLVDLGKNYISLINKESIIFTNSKLTKCNGQSIPAKEYLGSVVYTHKRQDDSLQEKVVYTGCNSKISLVEEITTKGINLEPLSLSDIIKGKRSFDLKDNETLRFYKVLNAEGQEIFSVLIEKKDSSKIINFTILRQKFLTMTYEYQSDATRVLFSYFGYVASYKRTYSNWNMRNNFRAFTNAVVAKRGELVTYLNGDGSLISLSSFTKTFNEIVMNNTINNLSSIFEYHMYYLPETEATKTNNQSQRFIDEIRLAKNRVTANTEINLVKNLLQELIDAAELGQIIDNRPKKN